MNDLMNNKNGVTEAKYGLLIYYDFFFLWLIIIIELIDLAIS